NREYQLITSSTNSGWLAYNDKKINIVEPTTIRARKIMENGTVIYDEFEVTPEMLGYNLPIAPVIKVENYLEFVYPNIQREINHSYEAFVNGVPYKFGQPLIDYSNNSRGEGTEYELTVKSKHYKFPDREAVSKKKIVVNSTPPEKIRLKGIIGKRINLHALGTLFKFEIENNTSSRYENKMIIDGERYPIGTTLSSIN